MGMTIDMHKNKLLRLEAFKTIPTFFIDTRMNELYFSLRDTEPADLCLAIGFDQRYTKTIVSENHNTHLKVQTIFFVFGL